MSPRQPFRWSLVAPLLTLLLAASPARAAPRAMGPLWAEDPPLDPRAEPPSRPPKEGVLGGRAPLFVALELGARSSHDRQEISLMLLAGIPLDRLARAGRLSISDPARPAPPTPEPPKLKASRTVQKLPEAEPLDKLPPATREPPIPIPIILSADVARTMVDAALKRAKLHDPEAHVRALAVRARVSAALPELRLRVSRGVDQGRSLVPTEYDPDRVTATGGTSLWIEGRATWRLDRLVFAEEEATFERLRRDLAAARAKLTAEVLRALFTWQKALASSHIPNASPEELLRARLKVIEAEVELDVMTGGAFGKWRKEAPAAPPKPAPAEEKR